MNRFVLFLFFIVLIDYSFGARYFVKTNGSSANSGLSWDNAFSSLQTALSNSIYGDEIWVATGTYKPTSNNDRTISFILKNGVNIYGGFSGNETTINQRDISANPTTLSGDIGQTGYNADNSHSIIKGSNINTIITLDGFRIIDGYSGISYYGGGLHYSNSLNGNLILKRCYFYSNVSYYYGGAIYLDGAKLTIQDCDFINNQSISGGSGGAIYSIVNNTGSNTLSITDSRFIGNTSRTGACLDNVGNFKSLYIDRCIFTNNTSEYSILEIQYFDSLKIFNSYVIGNTVNNFSSKIIDIIHYTNHYTEDCEMVNCTIADNYNIYQSSSLQSEVINFSKSYYKIRNCIIYGNTEYNGRQMNGGMQVSNSLIQGGFPTGVNIYNVNPLFVNPANEVSNFDASAYNYSLQATSPCINVGNNTFLDQRFMFDLNKQNRVQKDTVDIGAYESNYNNCKPPAPINTTNLQNLNICSNSYTVLTASGIGLLSWYNLPSGGTKIGTGNTFSTPLISSQTTYYVQDSTSCGASLSRTPIVVFLLPAKTTNRTQAICQGQSYAFNGMHLTTAGTYRDTLQQVNGCDSFIVLTLNVNPAKTTNRTQTICQGQSYSFNGMNLSTAGTYRDTLQQVNGCDSFIVLTLNVIPSKTTNITQTIQQGQTFVFNGMSLTTAGIYRDTLQQVNGCDSFIVLTLSVITGMNNNISFLDQLAVYPNPAEDFISIELSSKKPADFQLEIIGIDGKVYWQRAYNSTRIIQDKISLSDLAKGMYFMKIRADYEQVSYKIIKK